MSATSIDARWQALRPQLLHLGTAFPAPAYAALRAQRGEFAPLLAHELEQLAEDPRPATEDPDYTLHFHVIALLSEWREPGAWQGLLRLVEIDEDAEEALFGFIGGDIIGRALATLCPGDITPLQMLANKPQVSRWIRGAALEAIAIRACAGDCPREQAIAALLQQAHHEAAALAPKPAELRDEFLLTHACGLLAELAANACVTDIVQWCDADLIDPTLYGDKAQLIALLERDPLLATIAYLESSKGYINDAEALLSALPMYHHEAPPVPLQSLQTPFIREVPKVGRNDDCPCGSGRKYKKCCGAH